MTLSVEDVINTSLRRIGYPTPIGYIYEGSRASRAAVEVFAQTRDRTLEARDWLFARQEVSLVLLKTALVGGYGLTPWTNTYPLLPWIYEYDYPDGCMAIRAIRPTPVLIPQFDPVPSIFTTANDPSYTPSRKVVLTNVAGAIACFTARITDPDLWVQEPSFLEAMIEALALRLQEALNPQPDEVKLRAAEASTGMTMADDRG